jgi:uridine phosphorylase
MKAIKDTELIITKDKKIYHLNIDKYEIENDIILVGDQDRVSQISKHFDEITHKVQHREFVTHTGTYNGKRISAISTGIGCDNIDIVINELDALVNIDFETRIINPEKKKLNLIRLGTSGSLQADILVDSFLISEYAIGFDGLAHFHENTDCIEKEMSEAFIKYSNWPQKLPEPYIIKASENLLQKFKGYNKGITATAPGFYAPQGREIRLKSAIPNMHESLNTFNYNDNRITNFEMESSALYYLGQSLGHNTITICAIIGNRVSKTQSENYKETVEELIIEVLDKI